MLLFSKSLIWGYAVDLGFERHLSGCILCDAWVFELCYDVSRPLLCGQNMGNVAKKRGGANGDGWVHWPQILAIWATMQLPVWGLGVRFFWVSGLQRVLRCVMRKPYFFGDVSHAWKKNKMLRHVT